MRVFMLSHAQCQNHPIETEIKDIIKTTASARRVRHYTPLKKFQND